MSEKTIMTVESKAIASFVFLGALAWLLSSTAINQVAIGGVEQLNNTQPPRELDKNISDYESRSNININEFNQPFEHPSGNLYTKAYEKGSESGDGILVYDVSESDQVKIYSQDYILLPTDCNVDSTLYYNDGTQETFATCATSIVDTTEADELSIAIKDTTQDLYNLEFQTGQDQSIRDYADYIFNLTSENQFISLVILIPMTVLFSLLVLKIIPTVL